jgi:hypothetical protein
MFNTLGLHESSQRSSTSQLPVLFPLQLSLCLSWAQHRHPQHLVGSRTQYQPHFCHCPMPPSSTLPPSLSRHTCAVSAEAVTQSNQSAKRTAQHVLSFWTWGLSVLPLLLERQDGPSLRLAKEWSTGLLEVVYDVIKAMVRECWCGVLLGCGCSCCWSLGC